MRICASVVRFERVGLSARVGSRGLGVQMRMEKSLAPSCCDPPSVPKSAVTSFLTCLTLPDASTFHAVGLSR